MLFETDYPATCPLRHAIQEAYLANETDCVERLLSKTQLPDEAMPRVEALARRLVLAIRKKHPPHGLDVLLHEYDLSSREGIVLMCLAEALLRIPDPDTANRLIKDKLSTADWEKHLDDSDSWLVSASTWGLMLTGKIVDLSSRDEAKSVLVGMLARGGEHLTRLALG
ncbi:MAG: trifunctional transcriptional regulator/proline dehydrogenase/L-glutamate gamma-semialdehyde dehydrogenase, partial [Burkholderiales bacterium]